MSHSETVAPATTAAPTEESKPAETSAGEEEAKKEEKAQSPKMYRRLSARIGQFLHTDASSKKASKKPAVAEESEASKEAEAPKAASNDEAPVVSQLREAWPAMLC